MIQYEWRRISSVPGTWILAAIAIVLAGAFQALIVANTPAEPDGPGNLAACLTLPLLFGGFVFAGFGAQSIGQEYRFGTIRSTLTLFPIRPAVFAAKLAVAGAFALAVFLVAAAACVVIAAVAGQTLGLSGAVWALAARVAVVVIGWLAWGFGIAALTRNTALGIVLPLVIALIVEVPLVSVFGGRFPWIADILPFTNALQAQSLTDGGWGGLGIFGLWSLAVAACAYFAFVYRDA
ncbi:ABC transporter permease [Longispora albida]|uniref:ABC transporter permease n=1 Tax=Longispora albida TaxID=203523 RepID=UPI00036D62B5|nr:ABC transporter permease [Longispora albida]